MSTRWPSRTALCALGLVAVAMLLVAGCASGVKPHPRPLEPWNQPKATQQRTVSARVAIQAAIDVVNVTHLQVLHTHVLWESCSDDGDHAPYRAEIHGGIAGLPKNDAEVARQVDAWVELLRQHGWHFVTVPSTGTRSGGHGADQLGVQLSPGGGLVDPDFLLTSPCTVTEYLASGGLAGPDITDIINGRAPNKYATENVPVEDSSSTPTPTQAGCPFPQGCSTPAPLSDLPRSPVPSPR